MIASKIIFDPILKTYLLVPLILALAIGIILMEIRRKHRYLILRILASIISLLAISGLAFRPSIHDMEPAQPILLLTENYSPRIADSLASKNPHLSIIRTAGIEVYPNSTLLPDLKKLTDIQARIQFVAGEGIPIYILDGMEGTHFTFFPAPPTNGVLELGLHSFYANRTNKIEGKFRSGNSKTILRLQSPDGIEDSVFVQPNEFQHFSLKFKAPLSGKFTYQLITETEKARTLETLPIEILEDKKLSVLIVQQYPTAEIRYLKNYLSDSHHKIVARYRVSQNQFRYEYANGGTSTEIFAPKNLQSFDLAIIDSESIDRLTSSEQKALKQSIREGLGVIVTGSSSSKLFPFVQYKSAADTISLNLPSGNKITLPLVTLSQRPKNFEDVLFLHNKPLSGYQYSGFGKIGYPLVQETYTLQSKGMKDDYARIWIPLIESVSRSTAQHFKIKTGEFPLRVDEPISFEVISSGDKPKIFCDSTVIPLLQDDQIHELWRGKAWESRSGWHSLNIPADSTILKFYVSKNDDWRSLSLANQIERNKTYATDHVTNRTENLQEITHEIPRLIFFLLFVISSGALWLLPKL